MRHLALIVVVAGIGCSRATPQSARPNVEAVPPSEHVYRTVDGVPLRVFVFKPTAPRQSGRTPAILLYHGGGWVAGAPDWTFASARRYAALGMVAIAVEYRLSRGGVTPVEALEDVCSSFRWARAQAEVLAIDPRRIAASGVSAGGHLASATATIGCGNADGAYGTGGPDALVLWSPALDVSGDGHFRRLLGERATVESLNPAEHVRARMPPAVIVHGERDNLTPLSGVRRFCDRVEAGGGRCVVYAYPGVGHLLTRNLADQENNFDPDPIARADGNAKQLEFLRDLWFR
jgi:acetyl esterase/lipase